MARTDMAQLSRIIHRALANMSQSMADRYVEKNAQFRYNAGLSPQIIRTSSGHCCEWCNQVAGKYSYPDVPKDVYRRHDNCDCTVEYVTEKGKRNVWSKEKITINTDDIDYMSHSFIPKYGNIFQIKHNSIDFNVRKILNSKLDMYAEDGTNKMAIKLCENILCSLRKKGYDIPRICILNFEDNKLNSNAIAGYDHESGTLFWNSKYKTIDSVLNFVNKHKGEFAGKDVYTPFLHELGHKRYYDCINELAKKKNITYNRAKTIIDSNISEYIHGNDKYFLLDNVSQYAQVGYDIGNLSEIIAEANTMTGHIAEQLISLLKGE